MKKICSLFTKFLTVCILMIVLLHSLFELSLAAGSFYSESTAPHYSDQNRPDIPTSLVESNYGRDRAFTKQGSFVSITSTPVFTETAVITGSDVMSNASFGDSVSIDGDTLVVGTSYDFTGIAGAAYVFARNAGGVPNSWGEVSKLVPSDSALGDNFGTSVAVSGNTIVVGAEYADVGGNLEQGAAYVFEYDSINDSWDEVAKLVASDGEADDWFGTSVSIHNDTIVVGALGNNNFQGAAYVFEWDTNGNPAAWSEVKKITADDGNNYEQFGISVGVSGDNIVVGANAATVSGNSLQGAAYVFERFAGGTPEGWGQVAKLVGSLGGANDLFGTAVAINNNRIVVGAWGQNSDLGAAYIYEYPNDVWIETTQLLAIDGQLGDGFGLGVALLGDTVVIGAPGVDVNGSSSQGASYIFQYIFNEWVEIDKLVASDGTSDDLFGISVAITDQALAVGAELKSPVGAAYLFEPVTINPPLSSITVEDASTSEGAPDQTIRMVTIKR
ncbi:MAG: FG-GAP repeat protein [Ardenticatenaceae bacterium]|nr:FG-GAP repeat protein [Ardenticatenaceae bacterium]